MPHCKPFPGAQWLKGGWGAQSPPLCEPSRPFLNLTSFPVVPQGASGLLGARLKTSAGLKDELD